MKTNSAGEKCKLLSQIERDGKFWVQNFPRRIRPVRSLCRQRSTHRLCYTIARSNKRKSPDGHRVWDLDCDADWGCGGGNSCCNPATSFALLTRLQERQQQSHILFSQKQKKLTGLTLLIQLLFHLSTAVYTPPQHNPTSSCTSKLHHLQSQLKNSCPPHRFLLFLQLFLTHISSVIWYYHKASPTVVQPQSKKWQTALTVVVFLSHLWCWKQHPIKLQCS